MTMERVAARLKIRLRNGDGSCAIEPIAGCYHCDAEWEGPFAWHRARDHAAASGHDTWRLTGQWDIICASKKAA